ncbi:NAD(P)-binding protein [Coprinopsis marcescibilis]|uniref:NAD(P)-binding protein n=1 Tax=Coprinopsis marcescibilis TaxID=230819 RepID=A0A5C3KLK4_COPMA|nr:NAD(P)-binding protein [Coprinopsis marcescibilis]
MSTAVASTPAPLPKPIRLGFIGFSPNSGWGGQTHGSALLDPEVREHYKLVAVGTSNPTSAAASATHFTKVFKTPVQGFSDAKTLAEWDEVDLVAVSVKCPLHYDVLKKVIEAGKPFFIEWPFGRNAKETEELVNLAKEKGVQGWVGLQGRQSPLFRKVGKAIKEGKIGKVHNVNVLHRIPLEQQTWVQFTPESHRYHTKRENGATSITIFNGHFIDTILETLGDTFSKVSARGEKHFPTTTLIDDYGRPIETLPTYLPDHFTINGVLKKSGAWVTITVTHGLPSHSSRSSQRYTIDVDGEEGTVRVEGGPSYPSFGDPHTVLLNGQNVTLGLGEGRRYTSVVDFLKQGWLEFAKGKEGGGYFADLETALVHRKAIGAIEDSLAEDGRWIEL